MLEDFERLVRQVTETSRQLARIFDEAWGQGPKISVHETEKAVKLVVEPPSNQHVKNWAVRVVDDTVFLRGLYTSELSVHSDLGGFHREKRSDEFIRSVQVPFPIEGQPSSVKRDGRNVALTFQKLKRRPSDGWFDLDI